MIVIKNKISEEKIKALKLVKLDGYNLKWLKNFCNDKDVVLIAVSNELLAHGYEMALSFASETLQNDEEVVLRAVNRAGLALKFASQRLKANEKIVMAAVANESSSFEYADDSLKNDPKFIAKIITFAPAAFYHVGDKIQNNLSFIKQLAIINPEIIKYIRNKEIKKSLKEERKVTSGKR